MNCPKCNRQYVVLETDDGTVRGTCACEFSQTCTRAKKKCGLVVVALVDPYDVTQAIEFWCDKCVPTEYEAVRTPISIKEQEAPKKAKVVVKRTTLSDNQGCSISSCTNPPTHRIDYGLETRSDYCETCLPFVESVLVDSRAIYEVRRLR